ncbi:MAG TPA: hypothetical protein VKE95_21725 [Burkholderiales bacterium]|nr:hypothetical protein [Burkholderiales bacterium]
MNARRVFLWRAGLIPLLAASGAAWAAKLSKGDLQYRDRPIAGAVSPHGYCLAFTPKPAG